MMSNSLLVSIWTLICLFVICSGRTPQLIGGWSDLNTNDLSVKNITDFAVDMYNKQSNSINMKQLVTIKSAKSQLVAGRKFSITFAVGETNCSKNGIQRNNHKECPLTNTSVSVVHNYNLIGKDLHIQEIQII